MLGGLIPFASSPNYMMSLHVTINPKLYLAKAAAKPCKAKHSSNKHGQGPAEQQPPPEQPPQIQTPPEQPPEGIPLRAP